MQKLEFAPIYVYRLGACSRCLRSDRLVDIDVLIEHDGNVALCEGCIADAAVTAGLIVTERGADRLAAAEKRAAEFEARAQEAERLLAGLQTSLTRMKNLKPKAKESE